VRSEEAVMVRLLVVEDDKIVRELVCNMLIDEGYHVDTAEHSGIGLQHMCDSRGSLVVLLGQLMPHVNGEEVLRAVDADPALQRHGIMLGASVPKRATTGRVAGLRT
jgi:CheY-like chemotaxis protein